MRRHVGAVLVGLALVLVLEAGGGAWAQTPTAGVVYSLQPPPTVGTVYSSFYYVPARYDAGALGNTYIAPYNYYLAPYGLPAREYVGFGTNDFPFYGRPYGNPSEPWSWNALASYPDSRLMRYYYPPVP